MPLLKKIITLKIQVSLVRSLTLLISPAGRVVIVLESLRELRPVVCLMLAESIPFSIDSPTLRTQLERGGTGWRKAFIIANCDRVSLFDKFDAVLSLFLTPL